MAKLELPVFVYGSLRRDQKNYFLLRGKTVSEQPATLDRMGFYRFGGYP
ncbi:MAG: gamma-glutamylcyclotransferase family protein, partial [Chloroflexota bacterium]